MVAACSCGYLAGLRSGDPSDAAVQRTHSRCDMTSPGAAAGLRSPGAGTQASRVADQSTNRIGRETSTLSQMTLFYTCRNSSRSPSLVLVRPHSVSCCIHMPAYHGLDAAQTGDSPGPAVPPSAGGGGGGGRGW